MSQSVRRALDLLAQLGAGPRSLDEPVRGSRVLTTTVMRLPHSLEPGAFVVRDSRQRNLLGPRSLELSALALERRDVRTVAGPHLVTLARAADPCWIAPKGPENDQGNRPHHRRARPGPRVLPAG